MIYSEGIKAVFSDMTLIDNQFNAGMMHGGPDDGTANTLMKNMKLFGYGPGKDCVTGHKCVCTQKKAITLAYVT